MPAAFTGHPKLVSMPLRDPEVWRTVGLIRGRASAAQLYRLFQQTCRAPHGDPR